MSKRVFSPLFVFVFLFLWGCGDASSGNSTDKTEPKTETSTENEGLSEEETIIGTWRHEEDGGKSFEEWKFSKDEFTHEGGGAMSFKEKGTYSIEDLKGGSATLALTDIQGNMGSDDRTIIVSVGADKTQVSVNNLNFKRVVQK